MKHFGTLADKKIKDTCIIYNIPCILHNEENVDTAAQGIACEVDNLNGDIYLNIQGDEPLLDPNALVQIIDEMIINKEEYYVGLYSLIETEEEFKSRNTVKTVLDDNDYALYFSRSCIPEKFEYGNAYRVMGLYGYRPWILKEFTNIYRTKLESLESGIEMIRMLQKGYKIKFLKTNYRSIGVDLPEHIEEVEKVMKKTIHNKR